MNRLCAILVPALAAASCGGDRTGNPIDSTSISGSGATDSGITTSAGSASDSATTGENLDVGTVDPTDGNVDMCKVVYDPDGGLNGAGKCEQVAPPDSFLPEVQWQYNEDIQLGSFTTPLVANLTDDNNDGVVDLCDTPDVVLVAVPWGGDHIMDRHMYVFDGATGALHYKTKEAVGAGTPAIGDMDFDGEPEIVTVLCTGPNQFDNSTCDGNIATWSGRTGETKVIGDVSPSQSYGCHIALADVDNDGDVEILCRTRLFDHEGIRIFDYYEDTWDGIALYAYNAPTIADLDGDGDQEILLGSSAFHDDGTMFWETNVAPGIPQVGNFDEDDHPEILITNLQGIAMLEHEGQVKYANKRPTGVPGEALNWGRPATIHDFDGDSVAEYALSSQTFYTVYEADASILWSAPVLDQSGIAAGTAFDFLGDGKAEAMYADEEFMFVFDDTGKVLLQIPRTSGTIVEYPVVADVDNDGSAEIIVVSEGDLDWKDKPFAERTPVIQVIKEEQDRWIQARRIWNQHTYHVTNVAEDGTIPQYEQPSWLDLNTFRTNAQIEGGSVCKPEPVPEG